MRRLRYVLLLLLLGAPALASDGNVPALLSAGRLDDALMVLHSRVRSAPDDAQSYSLLCRAYFALEDWDQAIAACEKSVALEPSNPEYHVWLGRAYGEKADSSSFLTAAGLAKKIRTEFERAVELDAKSVAARSDLAEFYVEAPGFMGGGKNKAQQQADEIQRQDEARAYWLRARIAEKDKNYDQAIQYYQSAIRASGNEGSYWLNLASFYRRLNRLPDMEDAVNKAISAEHRKSNVLFEAAQLLLRTGRSLPEAANMLRRYISGTTSEDAPVFQAHYVLGQVLEKQGDKQGAAEQYRAALSLAKDYSPARQALKRIGSSGDISGR